MSVYYVFSSLGAGHTQSFVVWSPLRGSLFIYRMNRFPRSGLHTIKDCLWPAPRNLKGLQIRHFTPAYKITSEKLLPDKFWIQHKKLYSSYFIKFLKQNFFLKWSCRPPWFHTCSCKLFLIPGCCNTSIYITYERCWFMQCLSIYSSRKW